MKRFSAESLLRYGNDQQGQAGKQEEEKQTEPKEPEKNDQETVAETDERFMDAYWPEIEV